MQSLEDTIGGQKLSRRQPDHAGYRYRVRGCIQGPETSPSIALMCDSGKLSGEAQATVLTCHWESRLDMITITF